MSFMSLELTTTLSISLLSLSLLLQSLEMLSLCNRVAANTPWSWSHIRNDFIHWPPFLLSSFDQLYGHHFKFLILTQVVLALLLPAMPALMLPLLITTSLLIALRFRGSFNGGSDAMTMATTISLLLSLSSPVGFYLLAFHCTLSYFIAGIVKLKSNAWRSGEALPIFLTQSNYAVPLPIQNIASHKFVMTLASWGVIGFECSFPLVWLLPQLTPTYIILAILFHVMNYFCLGLNRFVFTWFVSYPALLYCIQR